MMSSKVVSPHLGAEPHGSSVETERLKRNKVARGGALQSRSLPPRFSKPPAGRRWATEIEASFGPVVRASFQPGTAAYACCWLVVVRLHPPHDGEIGGFLISTLLNSIPAAWQKKKEIPAGCRRGSTSPHLPNNPRKQVVQACNRLAVGSRLYARLTVRRQLAAAAPSADRWSPRGAIYIGPPCLPLSLVR